MHGHHVFLIFSEHLAVLCTTRARLYFGLSVELVILALKTVDFFCVRVLYHPSCVHECTLKCCYLTVLYVHLFKFNLDQARDAITQGTHPVTEDEAVLVSNYLGNLTFTFAQHKMSSRGAW